MGWQVNTRTGYWPVCEIITLNLATVRYVDLITYSLGVSFWPQSCAYVSPPQRTTRLSLCCYSGQWCGWMLVLCLNHRHCWMHLVARQTHIAGNAATSGVRRISIISTSQFCNVCQLGTNILPTLLLVATCIHVLVRIKTLLGEVFSRGHTVILKVGRIATGWVKNDH